MLACIVGRTELDYSPPPPHLRMTNKLDPITWYLPGSVQTGFVSTVIFGMTSPDELVIMGADDVNR